MAKQAEKSSKTIAKKAVKKDARKVAKKKTAPANDSEAVNEYMRKLKHPLKAEMEAVRAIILKASSKVQERVKWNAPSFFYQEDLAAFNPRAKAYVHLVLLFPKGLVKEDTGLLEGNFKDRRMAYFYNMADVKSKKAALEKVVKDWVKLIDQK